MTWIYQRQVILSSLDKTVVPLAEGNRIDHKKINNIQLWKYLLRQKK